MNLPSELDYATVQHELELAGWIKMPDLNIMRHPDKPTVFKSLTTELMLKKPVKHRV